MVLSVCLCVVLLGVTVTADWRSDAQARIDDIRRVTITVTYVTYCLYMHMLYHVLFNVILNWELTITYDQN